MDPVIEMSRVPLFCPDFIKESMSLVVSPSFSDSFLLITVRDAVVAKTRHCRSLRTFVEAGEQGSDLC